MTKGDRVEDPAGYLWEFSRIFCKASASKREKIAFKEIESARSAFPHLQFFRSAEMQTETTRRQRVDEAIYRTVAIAAAVLIVIGVLVA
jgi:ElaB/YqjD/DUF883 family membrane-anchored ribosome-binding protein